MNSWSAVVDVGKGGSEVDITRKGEGGDGFIAGQSFQRKGRECREAPNKESNKEHIICDRSEFRDLEKEFCPKVEKAHQSKKRKRKR